MVKHYQILTSKEKATTIKNKRMTVLQVNREQ